MRHEALGEAELASIESSYGFRFPPDLRAFLREGPPTLVDGRSWMDWRAGRAEIEQLLAWPVDGVAAYFEESAFWLPAWGPRPPALEDRKRFLAEAPRLIPIGGQLYMSAEPCEAGNPVFSTYGIDIIVAGCDLADYLAGGSRSIETKGAARHIRFWSDIVYTHWSDGLEQLRRQMLDK